MAGKCSQRSVDGSRGIGGEYLSATDIAVAPAVHGVTELHPVKGIGNTFRPAEVEKDFAYLQRLKEMKTELVREVQELETVWLCLFFESFPATVKRKVGEQPGSPANEQDLIALLAIIRPSLRLQNEKSGSLHGRESIPLADRVRHPNKHTTRGGRSQQNPSRKGESTIASSQARIEVDAFIAISRILSQKDKDGQWTSVALHSQRLIAAEQSYGISDQALLAIVESFKE